MPDITKIKSMNITRNKSKTYFHSRGKIKNDFYDFFNFHS